MLVLPNIYVYVWVISGATNRLLSGVLPMLLSDLRILPRTTDNDGIQLFMYHLYWKYWPQDGVCLEPMLLCLTSVILTINNLLSFLFLWSYKQSCWLYLACLPFLLANILKNRDDCNEAFMQACHLSCCSMALLLWDHHLSWGISPEFNSLRSAAVDCPRCCLSSSSQAAIGSWSCTNIIIKAAS